MKMSFHTGQGKKMYSRRHNNRTQQKHTADYLTTHDSERVRLNMVLIDEDPKKYYYDTFKAAVDDFNEHEKHLNRHKDISKLYQDCLNQDLKEIIIQVGNGESIDRKAEQLTDEQYAAVYQDVLKEFQEKNNNMHVIGAYIHFDETTPHMHLDIIPTAEKNKGMKLCSQFHTALKNQGYKGSEKYSEKAFNQWRDDMVNMISDIVKDDTGITLEPQEHKKADGLTTTEWKRKEEEKRLNMTKNERADNEYMNELLEDRIDNLTEQEQQLNKSIADNQEILNAQQKEILKANQNLQKIKTTYNKGVHAVKELSETYQKGKAANKKLNQEISEKITALTKATYALNQPMNSAALSQTVIHAKKILDNTKTQEISREKGERRNEIHISKRDSVQER